MTNQHFKRSKAAFALAVGMSSASTLPVLAECVVQDRVKISVYAESFDNKPMSNGVKFHTNSNKGAHRTLPFGTTVELTDLETGKTSDMVVMDRGPHVAGRTYDVPGSVWKDLRGEEKYGLTWVRAKYCTPS